MRITISICAALGVALAAGPARADQVNEGEARRVVDRPLLLPSKSFGVDANFRGSDGVDGAMFEYTVAGLEVGTGSGVTDIKFGMDLLVSQPSNTNLDTLDKVYVRLATGVGTGGVIALSFHSFKPATDEAIKPQVVDFSVIFKRAVAADVAILAGGGFDFTYLLFPEGLDPDVSVWATRFHLRGGGQYQVTPEIAAEASLGVYIPIAQSPDTDEPGGLDLATTLSGRGRGYYTISSGFDVYLELSFNSEDDLLASLGETKTALLGVRGAL